MQSMSDDDAAYSALLAQLLSDSAHSRNARVHSWIEHQYDFVFSEQSAPFPSSRPPSPSPSSSLGARRTCSIDRPDSPLLPRLSSERPSSPCPSYDALFFPPSNPKPDISDFEEQERVRALRFIVQEMAHWKSHIAPPSPPLFSDKPLPAPPPSPVSSVTQSTSSRAMRSRSSSTRISRLPSFTSTLSSDQSHPQEIPPPLPVSVIVHGEFQHELILSREIPLIDGYLHKRDDSCPRSLMQCHDQDGQLLSPLMDDTDSAFNPSPTCTSFSFAHSRETSFTTPYTSSPASPASAVFSSSCSPENVALPSSPVDEYPSHQSAVLSSLSLASFSTSSPQTNVSPASPTSPVLSVENTIPDGSPHRLRAPKAIECPQSRWSIATTVSLTSNVDSKASGFLSTKLPQGRKDGVIKTPRKRTRFISLISRLSPGRSDPSSTTTSQTTDDAECDSVNESDSEDKDKSRQRKSLSKKSSLASLRASFSISRASFSSQRPPLSSPTEEVPPLPTSPTLSSPLADTFVPTEIVASPARPSFSKIPSRANLISTPLSPIPQSASTITTFQTSSRVSVSSISAESRISRNATGNSSRVSLIPPPSKRTSLASAAGIEPMVAPSSVPASQATVRSKSIFRLTAKPKNLKTSTVQAAKQTSKPALSNNTSVTVRSRIPQAPTKFTPPAKLATVIATQSRQAPVLATHGVTSSSKLPTPLSRPPPKVLRPVATSEKLPVESLVQTSRLPMPAAKGGRVGTVKGFWKRQ